MSAALTLAQREAVRDGESALRDWCVSDSEPSMLAAETLLTVLEAPSIEQVRADEREACATQCDVAYNTGRARCLAELRAAMQEARQGMEARRGNSPYPLVSQRNFYAPAGHEHTPMPSYDPEEYQRLARVAETTLALIARLEVRVPAAQRGGAQ